MGEIKTDDIREVKNTAIENYQNIKPETDMRVQDVRNTWESVFRNNTDGTKSEVIKEGNKDGTEGINKEYSNLKKEIGNNQEAGNELKSQGETDRTDEENTLLQKLLSGELDGLVGDVYYTLGGSTIWTEIKDGNPVRYKKGPGGKYFDGKENVRYEGKKYTQENWKTDDEKLAFLQKYGWLMENDEVKNYSRKFKPEN